jgi:hypothetical protein
MFNGKNITLEEAILKLQKQTKIVQNPPCMIIFNEFIPNYEKLKELDTHPVRNYHFSTRKERLNPLSEFLNHFDLFDKNEDSKIIWLHQKYLKGNLSLEDIETYHLLNIEPRKNIQHFPFSIIQLKAQRADQYILDYISNPHSNLEESKPLSPVEQYITELVN